MKYKKLDAMFNKIIETDPGQKITIEVSQRLLDEMKHSAKVGQSMTKQKRREY